MPEKASIAFMIASGGRLRIYALARFGLGGYATLAEFALKYYHAPEDTLTAFISSASIFFAIVCAAVITHDRTTGRIIERVFGRF
jgi:hypothetical protein